MSVTEMEVVRSPFSHPAPQVLTRYFISTALAAVTLALPATRLGADAATATGVRYDRLAVMGGAATVAHVIGFRYFDRAWYQGQRRDSIRWLNDWSGETYVHVDKMGHFMGGLFLSNSLSSAYRWTGFGDRSSTLLGTITSWAVLFEIEMRDAYFDQWGFSLHDFTANTTGAAVPLVHTLFPSTRIVGFKFSWWPSSLYLNYEERRDAGRPHTRYAIDDYEGMNFWLTLALNELLPGSAELRWPDWLGVALGFGARGMHGSNVKSRGQNREYSNLPSAKPELLLSFDFDPRFLPGDSLCWRELKSQLNWLRYPAPAVRLYPDFRFYFLYL
ncbi:MAG: DUF2279 domain-containing protein [Candidatus Latescibacterota bacterium]|nr:DUF2279 domain-containing protein [Candidatus Latescibacterota bacterium]